MNDLVDFQAFKAASTPEGDKAGGWRNNVMTAAALQAMRFPAPQWVIPDLIPEGLTILAGRPGPT